MAAVTEIEARRGTCGRVSPGGSGCCAPSPASRRFDRLDADLAGRTLRPAIDERFAATVADLASRRERMTGERAGLLADLEEVTAAARILEPDAGVLAAGPAIDRLTSGRSRRVAAAADRSDCHAAVSRATPRSTRPPAGSAIPMPRPFPPTGPRRRPPRACAPFSPSAPASRRARPISNAAAHSRRRGGSPRRRRGHRTARRGSPTGAGDPDRSRGARAGLARGRCRERVPVGRGSADRRGGGGSRRPRPSARPSRARGPARPQGRGGRGPCDRSGGPHRRRGWPGGGGRRAARRGSGDPSLASGDGGASDPRRARRPARCPDRCLGPRACDAVRRRHGARGRAP